MNKQITGIIEWTKLKIRIYLSSDIKFYFKERQIWWASLGANIGFEQDGKNDKFERPVLIFKKFNKYMAWCLPLTSKPKEGKYYYWFNYKDQRGTILLSQIRAISSKRLIRKIGILSYEDFKKVRELVKKLI